jgi:Leucine-rich repeat (LRR) protein
MIRRETRPVLTSRRRLRPPAPSHPPARAAGGSEVKRSQGRRVVSISHGFTLGRPDAGSADRKQSVVTNRDKKDSIRGRMASAGEPFNVARRKAEAAAAGHLSKPEFVGFGRIGRCDLSNRELTVLPPEIARLPGLWELRLDGNRLTALPPQITQLTGLQVLWLRHNQLTALPPQIGQLTGLRRLMLDGNQLTALPRELADLLSGGLKIGLAGNPLPRPFFELHDQGPQALASYLRGLE